MKYEDYQFEQSSYERPNKKHVCGRKRFWKKSCRQGPDHKGHCGGQSECKPTKIIHYQCAIKDGAECIKGTTSDGQCSQQNTCKPIQEKAVHYECARPSHAGGACQQGPNQDGSCCRQQPPCQPALSLREWRKRFSYILALFIVVFIMTFSFNPSSQDHSESMINPGTLSSKHQTFTDKNTCDNCHTSHSEDLTAWLASAFTKTQLTEKCITCHIFEGNEKSPHQMDFSESNKKVSQLECTACHTEHKGLNSTLTEVSNDTCSNCHEKTFSNFSQDHPEFSEGYPHKEKQKLFFDHKSHVSKHFKNKKSRSTPFYDGFKDYGSTKNASAASCQLCHDTNNATKDVKPLPYKTACLTCHEQQIPKNELIILKTRGKASPVLLGLQEQTIGLLDMKLKSKEKLMASNLIKELENDPMKTITNLTAGMENKHLWNGFNAFEASEASKKWVLKEKHNPTSNKSNAMKEMSGWFMGKDKKITYRATGHNDSVIKAWIELYLVKTHESKLTLKNATDEHKAMSKAEFLANNKALKTLLDPKKGPGYCGKCHAVGLLKQEIMPNTQINWGYKKQETSLHTLYDHKPHLNLTGAKASCSNCHALKKDKVIKTYFSEYFKRYFKPKKNKTIETLSYKSSFKDIKRQTCSTCHTEEKIQSDCVSCHQYHGKSALGANFMSTNHTRKNSHE